MTKSGRETYRKPTVSIGIPAFNEGNNIKRFVTSLTSQSNRGYILRTIVVASDGSCDNTVKEVKSIRDQRVRVIRGKTRKGKPYRINQMFSRFHSDIAVILDADLITRDSDVLNRILHPFIHDERVQFASGWAIPLPPHTITERIAYVNVNVWRSTVSDHPDNDLYYSSGSISVYRRSFYSKLTFDNYSADDAFAYITCREYGYKFQKILDTGFYFHLPNKWNDYVKQWVRFIQSDSIVSEMFGSAITAKYYTITHWDKINGLLKAFIRNPFWVSAYLVSRIMIGLSVGHNREQKSALWTIAQSTK